MGSKDRTRRSRRQFLEITAVTAGVGFCGRLASSGGGSPPAGPAGSGRDSRLGYCGLYCGGCQAFQETESGTLSDKLNACRGCASDVVAPWCRECAIKSCARAKGVRYCLQCGEYPCEKLTAFTNDPRYPYHKAVHADMARLKEIGIDAWLEEQAARWVCSTCGHKYHWFARRCATCGSRVNRQYWPD